MKIDVIDNMSDHARVKSDALLYATQGQGNKASIYQYCALISLLTSAKRDERENAKNFIRACVRHGQEQLKAQIIATELWKQHNRFEP